MHQVEIRQLLSDGFASATQRQIEQVKLGKEMSLNRVGYAKHMDCSTNGRSTLVDWWRNNHDTAVYTSLKLSL